MTIPYSLLAFSGFSLIFSYSGAPFISALFGWAAVMRLLNRFAPHLPLGRYIHWAHAMTFELLAFLCVILFRFLPSPKIGRGNKRPILLVHGYVNHPNVWLLQKRWLSSLGLGPIYAIKLGHPFKSIRFYGEKVKEKAKQIAQETGRDDLILIGHSMGGLVSAWYAIELARKGTVTDVVTIASPLAGTPLAYLGFGLNAKEMLKNSEFTSQLSKAIKESQEIRFHHIATKSDQIVIPGITAAIPENNHFIFEDLGHASLLFSKRTAKKIHEWVS